MLRRLELCSNFVSWRVHCVGPVLCVYGECSSLTGYTGRTGCFNAAKLQSFIEEALVDLPKMLEKNKKHLLGGGGRYLKMSSRSSSGFVYRCNSQGYNCFQQSRFW